MHDMKTKILFLRNKFFRGISDEGDKLLLHDLLAEAQQIEVEMTRKILTECIRESIKEIDTDIVNAGFILNFVHNFPFSPDEIAKWSVEYFMAIEIESMTDRLKTIPSALKLVLCACHHIYVERYMSK